MDCIWTGNSGTVDVTFCEKCGLRFKCWTARETAKKFEKCSPPIFDRGNHGK